MTVKSYVEIDNMYNKFVEIDSDSDYDHDDDQYNSDSTFNSHISIDSEMEVVGLTLSVVGLAGPLAKSCLSGYELLRSTADTAEDAGDFRLRVDTEMGLLSLWIKQWINPRTGRIRGSGVVGEQICVLAVDILGKIGVLLVDASKLQGKYGIQVKKGTEVLKTEIARVESGVGSGSASGGGTEVNRPGQGPMLQAVKKDEAPKIAHVEVKTSSNISTSTTANSGAPLLGSSNNRPRRQRIFRKLIQSFKGISSKPAISQLVISSASGAAQVATPGPTGTTIVVQATSPAGSAPSNVNQTTGAPSTPSTTTKKPFDVTKAPMKEVLATLESTRAEVEANLTKVNRLKWVMIDKEKANLLANELKGWNKRLFAMLPLRRLDPRGSKKKNKFYTLPHQASPNFTGRAVALSMLEEAFFSPGEPPADDDGDSEPEPERQRRAVLYGLGGAGKTQIALKFAEEHRDQFESIFWINSSSIDTVEASFREIAELLRLPVGSGNLISSVKNQLTHMRDKNWLLIFDNADDIKLMPYIPQGKHGNILITSRNPKVKRYLGPLDQRYYHVDEMPKDESVELLLKVAGLPYGVNASPEDSAHAEKIVEKLGYLALAIDQAGAYISNNGPIGTYLDTYESFRAELLVMDDLEASGYAYPVYQTWEISFLAVRKKSPAAADILEVFGYLHNQRIPRGIFELGTTTGSTDKDEDHPVALDALSFLLKSCFSQDATGVTKWKSFKFDNAINDLHTYSLIKKNSASTDKDIAPTYSLHPLVHSWTRDRKADPARKQKVQASTVSLLRNCILLASGHNAYILRSHLEAHINAWTYPNMETVPPTILGPTERAQIKTLEAISIVCHEFGRLPEAIKLRLRVLDWTTKNLTPPTHPDIIKARMELATTYRRSTINILKAKALDTETLELLEKDPSFGPDDPMTRMARLNLAGSLSEAGDRPGAEKLEREVLTSRMQVLGQDNIDVASAQNSLGVTLLRLRRYPSAETHLRAAYETRLKLVGEKHPGTLLTMGNLAAALRGQDIHPEALELGKKVLNTRVESLGENHQDVVRAKSNYGYSLMCSGDLEQAMKMEKEAAEQAESLLGPYHAFTMDALSNLGQVYLRMMDRDKTKMKEVAEQAEQTLTKLVERKDLVFGEEHTSTVEARKLLTQFYEKMESGVDGD